MTEKSVHADPEQERQRRFHEMAEQYRLDALLEQYKTTNNLALEDRKFALSSKVEELRGAFGFAALALRTLFILNGGAVVGILSFTGNLWARNDARGQSLAVLLVHPIGAFIVGTVMAALATTLSYVSQILFAERPAGEMSLPVAGLRVRLVACAAAFISMVAFIVGAIQSLLALATPLP